MSKRNQGMDAAKGLALLAVVLFHVEIRALQAWLAPFALSIFFFSSGYFARLEPWRTFFSKRAKRLLYPYLLCALATIVLAFLLGSLLYSPTTGILRAQEWAKAMLYGFGTTQENLGIAGAGPVWFLLCLFFASLFLQGLLRLKEAFRLPCLLLLFWIGLRSEYWLGFFLPWSLQPAMCALPLLYGAWIIHQNHALFPVSNQEVRRLLFVILLGLWADFALHYSEFAQVSNQFNRGWIDLLFSFVISWFLIQLCCLAVQKKPQSRVLQFLSFVGKNSLLLLCLHSLDLLVLNWKGLVLSFHWYPGWTGLFLILFALLRFGCICLVVWFLKKTAHRQENRM